MTTLILALAALLLLGIAPAQATILYQTDLETAVVPLDPNALDINGFYGAPQGWALARNHANRAAGTPFQGGPVADECYFTTEVAHSGTKSLKVQYTQTNPDGNPGGVAECSFCLGSDCILPSVATGIPGTLEFWMRAWVRFHNYGINPVARGNKVLYFHTSGTTGYPNAIMQAFGTSSSSATATRFGFVIQQSTDCGSPTDGGTVCTLEYCIPPQGSGITTYAPGCRTGGWTDPNQGAAAQPQDTWMCLEGHYRMNSVSGGVANADALFEQWVDGVLVTRLSNFVMRPATVAAVGSSMPSVDARFRGFQIYRQGARPGSVMYWDDIAIGDQRIGCGGVILGPPAIPNAPVSIQLTKNWLKRIWAWLLPNWA